MRTKFDIQLDELNTELIEMGARIERAIFLANEALLEQDAEKAKKVMEKDDKIDNMERSIERMCLMLLLQQQPVARDLRLISSALKMITDMERIGDQAADISELTIELSKAPYIKELITIPKMAEVTISMVKRSIDAYVHKDLDLAQEVIKEDDVVDDLFVEVKDDLIDLIAKDITNGTQALDLLMVAKYFERIGDHAVNIAEWVEFSITGRHKSGEIPLAEGKLKD
ncbi:MAG: phosphate signaling complex protein PhoU [Bacillota bacterium]|nr:phosphate signaling complex protein PhoU [Bacillota bacterium]